MAAFYIQDRCRLAEKSLSHSNALGLANASIRTTLGPTIIEGGVKENILPTIARAKINCRIMPGDNIDQVLSHVKKVIGMIE